MNRLETILNNNDFTNDPVSNMYLLMKNLRDGTINPKPNEYYIFAYQAKTPRITYDQHPFILCGNVYSWGFNGSNFHWDGEIRQYTWKEVKSPLYRIYPQEVDTMQSIPTAKFVQS